MEELLVVHEDFFHILHLKLSMLGSRLFWPLKSKTVCLFDLAHIRTNVEIYLQKVKRFMLLTDFNTLS